MVDINDVALEDHAALRTPPAAPAEIQAASDRERIVSVLDAMADTLRIPLFGERTNAVTNWLASRAGIGRGSSLSLFALLAPLIVNVVSMQAAGNGRLNARSLAGLLTGQSRHLRAAAPPGLAVAVGPELFGRPAIVVAPSAAGTGGFGGAEWTLVLAFLALAP